MAEQMGGRRVASEAEGTIDGRKAGLGPVVEVTALPSRKPPGGAVGTGGGRHLLGIACLFS